MKKLIVSFAVLAASQVIAGSNYSEKIQSSIVNIKTAKGDSAMSTKLYQSLTDSVFPSWMGTKWDFNGISNEPGKGEIACGYFVSTTLKHVGFNLNRYKLAQQGASEVIRVLCGSNKKHSYSKDSAISKFKALGNNKLYVVGLDYHVGYVSVENNQVYFIHSDFFLGKVVKELAASSQGFSATQSYVFGEITNNSSLLSKWKNGIKIY